MQPAKPVTSSTVAGPSAPGNNKVTTRCSWSAAWCRKWGKTYSWCLVQGDNTFSYVNWLLLLTLSLSGIFIPFTATSSIWDANLAFTAMTLIKRKQDRWKWNSITFSSVAGKWSPRCHLTKLQHVLHPRHGDHRQWCSPLTTAAEHHLIPLIAANKTYPVNTIISSNKSQRYHCSSTEVTNCTDYPS